MIIFFYIYLFIYSATINALKDKAIAPSKMSYQERQGLQHVTCQNPKLGATGFSFSPNPLLRHCYLKKGCAKTPNPLKEKGCDTRYIGYVTHVQSWTCVAYPTLSPKGICILTAYIFCNTSVQFGENQFKIFFVCIIKTFE